MRYLNKYLRNLSPYKVASHKIWDVPPDERTEMLKLDWNEATIPPSPKVRECLRALVDGDAFYYLYPSTYDARLHGLFSAYAGVSKDCIQYFASSDALHEYITRVFVSVGDPVLILGPTYDNFRLTCESQGAHIFYCEHPADFVFQPERLEADIERVCPSLVYICNPNNPTGNFIDVGYIGRLLSRFPETLFLIDEAYYEFTGKTAAPYVESHDNILITRTLSKAFALANFRVGYLISCPENISNISKVRNPKNITTFSQEAAAAVLSDLPYMQAYVEEVALAKADFFRFMSAFGRHVHLYPGEGNFVLMRFSDTELRDACTRYLDERNIMLRNLSHSPLLQNCLRITIGTRAQMDRVCSVLAKFFQQYGA